MAHYLRLYLLVYITLFIPKLQSHFAEFLKLSSPVALVLLH